eukprot:m.173554 g.173554  ORF g.173554 m.173554 type:complete len:282 (-) comp14586_c3_seq15:2894-3739(-)
MEEAHATVNALIARVDLCARMSGSQARCSGTALSFANEAGSVHVKARPLAINTEEAESMAFPFLVVEIVEGVPKPVQVTSLTELRQYLEGMAQALIVMASEYASNGIAQHTMDTVLGAVIHACATTHTQLDVYEASLAGDIMLGVENDISMQQATEHAAVINDVLAQYPQLQETLHPSMMDTEWKQNYRQYTGMTKEQLRAKNNKLFNMVKKFAKLMVQALFVLCAFSFALMSQVFNVLPHHHVVGFVVGFVALHRVEYHVRVNNVHDRQWVTLVVVMVRL